MKDVKLTVTINRPPRNVFEFSINPNNTPKWVDGVVKEQTNESPTKLGTIYRNQGLDGNWSEFEITAFEPGYMFELTKKDDDHHVKSTFKSLDNGQCELEYYVWVDSGDIDGRFAQDKIENILQKLKVVMEAQVL